MVELYACEFYLNKTVLKKREQRDSEGNRAEPCPAIPTKCSTTSQTYISENALVSYVCHL